MIEFKGLSKEFSTGGHTYNVFEDLNIRFPDGASVGLLGRNGAGKSTLLKIISGTMNATQGHVIRRGTVSWPVGFAGSFHPDLSGVQNARFLARIYDTDTTEVAEFVKSFAELGEHYYLPFRTYSSGMRSRLAFGVSMAIPFDTYLVDEITAVGDAAFREKSAHVFKERMKRSGAFVVSHTIQQIRDLCDVGAVLENGRLYYYDQIEAAIEHHTANLAARR